MSDNKLGYNSSFHSPFLLLPDVRSQSGRLFCGKVTPIEEVSGGQCRVRYGDIWCYEVAWHDK